MKLPAAPRPLTLGVLLSAAMTACGGGAGGDKPSASALVTPVSESASAVVAAASTDAASMPASAASAADSVSASASAAGAGTITTALALKATTPPPAPATVTTSSPAPAPTTKTDSTAGIATVVTAAAPASPAPSTAEASLTTSPSPSPSPSPAPSPAPSRALATAITTSPDRTILGASADIVSLQSTLLTSTAPPGTTLLTAAAAATPPATNVLTATTTTSTANSSCKVSYAAPASLTTTTPAPRPSVGGVFYTNAELAVWKQRLAAGPFLKANDFTKGSPGDWERINQNAADFIKNGDKGPLTTSATDEFARLGTGARDAAFLFLMTADGNAFTAVKTYLLAQVKNPAVDFPARLCLTDNNNWNPDGYYYQASWLLRYVATYDFVRSALSSADRVTIENFIRRNAYMLATQTDAALVNVFPNRLKGDYSKKQGPASATNGIVSWWSKRYDTNGDCKVDSSDMASAAPVYAYVKSDGVVGPRLTELSQFYNNRRAATALTFGAVGLVLGDAVLISSAKRYVFEWLTYGVWPDGSQGEYARNGDYCIPQQGVIYSAANTASAALLATLLSRQNDTTLTAFKTRDGLFGSESTGTAPDKTLALPVQTQLGLINGTIKWYYHKPWLPKQTPPEADAMTGFRSYYMKSTQPLENYQELGLLPAAKILPSTNIAGMVLRDKTVTSLPFPGATGNPVTTGWGNWNDPFNALPAALLIRP